MKQNKQAFSLVIAMGIVLVSSLLAYTILEYMIPFSQNVKGIENSTKAYYKSNQGIEKGLYFFSTRKDKNIRTDITDTTSDYNSSYSGTTFSTFSSGSTLPASGNGNSEYDNEWNTISVGNPIQLSVGYDFVNIDDLDINFRVPDINGRGELQDATGSGYISWQLVGGTGALYSSSGSLIKGDGMKSDNGKKVEIKGLKGISYDASGNEVQGVGLEGFFETNGIISGKNVNGINCVSPSQKCILKFSIIRELETDLGVKIPYLEWQISAGASEIPLRYSIIQSTGKSGEFARELELRYPQDTVNQAFDFTVLQ